MRIKAKKTSIYFKLAGLNVLAACIAALVFFIMYTVGNSLMDHYFINSDYLARKNNAEIQDLQNYINARNLSSDDLAKLNTWVKEKGIVSILIFKDGQLLYDSEGYNDQEVWAISEDEYYGWLEYYVIDFNDGQADIFISGAYTYQFYNYALIAELLLSFVLFLMIVMLGIRRSIKYIRKLNGEIEILEGGNLDYNITVRGNDELSDLAKGLDAMRISLKEQIEEDAYLTQTHRNLITEMSHDLRTPMTTILIYLDLILHNKYNNEEEHKEYIEKIKQKAGQMRSLSDRIFEYALINSDEQVKMEIPELIKSVLYDSLSEMTGYLEQNGYNVHMKMNWREVKIQVNTNYVMRVFDNIGTNLLKYANKESLIHLATVYLEDYVGIRFSNDKKSKPEKTESTKIGIRSIKTMMQSMHGDCIVEDNKDTFSITLLFHLHEE